MSISFISQRQSSELMRSMILPAFTWLLYDVEKEARNLALDGPGRLALRQEKSILILQDIKAYLVRGVRGFAQEP